MTRKCVEKTEANKRVGKRRYGNRRGGMERTATSKQQQQQYQQAATISQLNNNLTGNTPQNTARQCKHHLDDMAVAICIIMNAIFDLTPNLPKKPAIGDFAPDWALTAVRDSEPAVG
eukprot:m.69794 g.69794  ORF g.69794 m.69794 type:complete len:117 (+) comp12239_c1_seq1:928-1278(+)